MKFISKSLHILDYVLAIASLAYAIYAQSWLWAAGGLLSLVFARLKPADHIRNFLFKRIRRPAAVEVATRSGFPLPPTTPYVRRAERGSSSNS